MKYRSFRVINYVLAFVIFLSVLSNTYYGEELVVSTDETTEDFVFKDVPEVTAEGVIVVDMKTGFTLYEKNIYEKYRPASTTKIMTATLALENIQMDETILFSHDALFTLEQNSSSAYIQEGESMKFVDCMYGLLLHSANDIANGLAERVAGSMENFAKLMTEKAKSLGCVNTNFANAHGLYDENHYSCPKDMAVIAINAYNELPWFRKIISTYRYDVTANEFYTEDRLWVNGNKLINQYDERYDEDCLGGKTGYTSESGGNLVTYHHINGRDVVIVLMKNLNVPICFDDTNTICDYLTENLSQDVIDKMDEAYNKIQVAEQEKVSAQYVEDASSETTMVATNTTADDEDSDKTSFVFIIIIVLVLLVAGGLFYNHIRIINIRKHRMEMMKKKRENKNYSK